MWEPPWKIPKDFPGQFIGMGDLPSIFIHIVPSERSPQQKGDPGGVLPLPDQKRAFWDGMCFRNFQHIFQQALVMDLQTVLKEFFLCCRNLPIVHDFSPFFGILS